MALGALAGGGGGSGTAAAAGGGTTAVATAASTRASFAARGRRQSEAPNRKRSSVAVRRHAWTLKYHDFVPDSLHFGATGSRPFTSSKPEKFR